MKYSLYADKIEVTEADRTLLEEKLQRLEKYLNPPFTIDIALAHDTHHRTGEVVTCRINIESGKHVFHAEETGDTIQNCLDEVIHDLAQQLTKHQDKNRGY